MLLLGIVWEAYVALQVCWLLMNMFILGIMQIPLEMCFVDGAENFLVC